jgi:hypothetical protein
MTLEQIENLYRLGALSEIEFSDMLNKRCNALNKRINECTSGDSTWNDFQLWKAERYDINEILEKMDAP